MESDIKVHWDLKAARTTVGPPPIIHHTHHHPIMSTKRRKTSDEPSALKKATAPSNPELKKEKKVVKDKSSKDKSTTTTTTKKAEKTEKKQDAPEPTEQSPPAANSTEEDSATLDNAPEQEGEVETVKKTFKDLVCLPVNPVHVNAAKVLTDALHRELSMPSAKLANVSDTRTPPLFKQSRFLSPSKTATLLVLPRPVPVKQPPLPSLSYKRSSTSHSLYLPSSLRPQENWQPRLPRPLKRSAA